MKRILLTGLVCCLFSFSEAVAEANQDTMTTSWYGPGLQGNLMANGQVFDMNDPSVAAHKNLPFGTRIQLRNPTNDRLAVVTIQDRGPFIPGRELDVSKAVAQKLGFIDSGVIELEVKILK